MLSLIAAIGKNRELGRGGELLFRIPEDMQFFKSTTMGHKVLMGRKTWESLPGKLKGRTNIVVSRHPVEGADEWVQNLPEFIEKNKDTEEEIFIIGGGMVYFETLPYAKRLYLTEVDAEAPDADSFFPMFDKSQYSCEIIKKGPGYTISQFTSTGDGLGRDPAEHPEGGAAGGKSPAGPVERQTVTKGEK